jgi:hypothetical protein
MQVRKRITKQKLRDALLVHEGGEADAEPKQQIKAEESAWSKEKAEKIANFNCDERLKRGIIRDRGCTDVLCLILYFVFLGAMAYCCFVGYS